MIPLILCSAALLLAAYMTYGRFLARFLQLDDSRVTPAVEYAGNVDYEAQDRVPLLSQHFSAIAAAGPIVGPILAGVAFGWLPALIWILLGAIFIGGVHDFSALVASVRHRGKSIAEVTRENMSKRAFLLFLAFVWISLVYIVVAFTDVTASSFVGMQTLENGKQVTGAGTASASLMYLALPILMGLIIRAKILSSNVATLLFLPLIFLSIWAGQKFPLDVVPLIQQFTPTATAAELQVSAQRFWGVCLLVYCAIASVTPMWLLLQPRGQLGGWLLFAALGGGAAGLMLGGQGIQYPAFRGWQSAAGDPMIPMLFITIACGACSGFHALIASGTTSKQLRKESDAKPVAYGSMLFEAMVAILSLACVMRLSADSALFTSPKANLIYAQGIGSFLQEFGIPPELAVGFALMAFTTFVYDTLDICTRLGRYIIQELTGMQGSAGRWLGTILTSGAPILFLFRTVTNAQGQPMPVWQTFWSLFGASNQLLAALTLLTVTIWLWRAKRQMWVWIITGVPMVLMYCMSTAALIRMVLPHAQALRTGDFSNPVPWAASVLLILAGCMLLEAIASLRLPPWRMDEGQVCGRMAADGAVR